MATENNSEVISILALVVSVLAFALSGLTAWLTLLRRGTVKMTQPTVIFFGPDGPREARGDTPPKVFLRTLLFSTSKRGRIIENMYVSLSCEDISQDFNVWAYGERNELVRGSGLFIGETGVEANHHFLVPRDTKHFAFIPGTWSINVFAHLLGEKREQLLFSQSLTVSPEEAEMIGEQNAGLYFDWAPDKHQYVTHIDEEPSRLLKNLEIVGLLF
jgi:hypothetical protein